MKRATKFFGLAAGLLAVALPFVQMTRAESSTFQEGVSKRGLILSPLVLYLDGEKGQTVTGTYKLTNDFETEASVVVYPMVANFTQDDTGVPVIDKDPNQRPSDDNFASWVTLEKDEVVVQHREIKEINFTVDIPENATGGTHMAIILFPRTKTNANSNETSAEAKDQLGLPVILTIKSDVDFKSEISNMWVTNVKNKVKNFFWFGTARIHAEIKNDGNIYVRPFGNIFIHRGDKTKPITTLDFNPNGYLVQQHGKRLFPSDPSGFDINTNGFITEDAEGKLHFNRGRFFDFKFGRYYATYQARIKPSKEASLSEDKILVVEKTTSFFVLPIQFAILVALILIALFVVLFKKIAPSK